MMAAVTWKQLIKGFAADKTGMSIVISVVFGIGLIVSLLAALTLHKEWGILAKIKNSNKLPKSTGKSDIATVFQKLKGFKENSEVVDIHSAIDTYHSKHNSQVRMVSIMSALVISMGLLGTVYGLIVSISGLSGMVENITLSRATMMDEMLNTIIGMKTAFYTTFFGALSGLILRAVAVSQLNSLSELCSEAAEYADRNLTFRPENKEEALEDQVSKVISSFERMQQEIDALTGRIAESIEGTMGKFGESIEKVCEHAMESTQEAVSGMTDQMRTFGSTIEESLGAYNEQIVEAGKETREAIGAVNETISKSGEETREAIGTVNEAIVKSGDELHESFSGLNDRIAEAGDGMNSSFEGLNGTIDEAGGKVNEAFDSLNGSVQQAGDTVSGSLADFKLSVDGTAIELNEAVGELHTAISKATGEMVTMAQAKLDTEANEIAGQLSLAADSIQQFIQKKADAVNASDDNEESAKVA